MNKRSPFRLTAPHEDEDTLHESVKQLFDRVLVPGVEWTCFPAGNVPLPPQFAAKLSRMGLKPGWPDFLILHRWVFGIELKVIGGRLSATRMVRTRRGGVRMVEGQADVFPRLIGAGMSIAICRSLDDVVQALGDWQIPMRLAPSRAGLPEFATRFDAPP
jgi:hypothetical protein